MSRLTVRLLGPFEVRLGDALVTDFAYDKVRALLAYLVAEAGRPQRRERLIGLLWPDYPERSARQNLSQALYTLRSAIGDAIGPDEEPRFILATRQTVAFAPTADAWSDVAAFDAAIRAARSHPHVDLTACDPCLARLAEAVALYRGDFLQDLALDDSAAFEEWSLAQREARHQQMLWALESCTDHAEAGGDYDRALALARRQIALEPWRERAHRQAMRALALSRRRAEALAQFEACRRSLGEELGIRPDPQTRDLFERIRAGALQPPARTEPLPPGPATSEPLPTPSSIRPAPQPPSHGVKRSATAPVVDDERRWITLVLLDVSGSHDLMEQAGAEAWVEVLGPALDVLAAEARRIGGAFSQSAGDRATVTFGSLIAEEDDPERAIVAALAMQQTFAVYVREIGEERLALRVSVHRGEAIVTTVDGKPVTMGELFTSAQSTHATLAPGATWVDTTTHDLAAAAFSCQPLDGGYRPLAHLHSVDKGRGLPGLDAPLVGRDRELHALQAAMSTLQQGIGGIVTIVGEAGIGKSRLVAEARKEWREPAWVEGRCLSYATQTAFRMWVDVLWALIGVAAETPPIEVREALRRAVAGLCPDRFDDVYPLLAWLMALPLDQDAQARVRGIDAEGLRVLAFRAVEGFLAGAAARAPLVVALEDLHWADATSLQLLEALLPLTERVPLLFVCVMRPETDHPCWQIRELAGRDYRHRHTHLQLVPLSDAESASLVAHLLTVDDLPAALRARLLARAEGNPFFLEELLRALIDSGAIAFDAETGRWRATRDITALPLPATLHGVLAARIDRLPLVARQLLQVAAVIGRIVPLPLLASVVGTEALDDPLRALQRAELLRERARLPEVELIFKHQLTQEAAYAGLLTRKRRALHRRVAEAIEQRDADRIDERLGLLAHHWEQAGDAERAVTYLRRAGEQAAARFANDEAVDFYSQALELVPEDDLEQRCDLVLALEGVYDLQGQRDNQRQALASLEQMAEALGDLRRQAAVAVRQAYLATRVSDPARAAPAAEKALDLARQAGDLHSQAMAYRELSRALFYQGSYEEALLPATEAQVLAERMDLLDLRTKTLHTLGATYLILEDYTHAEERFLQELALCRALGDRKSEGEALRDLGYWYQFQARYQEALPWHLQALRACEETGNRRDEGWALVAIGDNKVGQGAITDAVVYLERALEVNSSMGEREPHEWSAFLLAYTANAQGRHVAALRYCEQFLGISYGRTTTGLRPSTLLEAGRALAAMGDYAGARGRAEEAVDACAAAQRQGPYAIASALGQLALIAHALGNDEQAEGYADQIVLLLPATEAVIYMHIREILHWGRAFTAVRRWDQAEIALRFVLDAPLVCDQLNLRIAARAGLAEASLAQGNHAQAAAYVTEALEALAQQPDLVATEEQVCAHLICYRVLAASGDSRAAEVLNNGYRIVMRRAADIADEDLRRSFLENVPVNRETVAAWEAASTPRRG